MNALASRADEGRGKLRKATARRTRSTNRRYPNGETYLNKLQPKLNKLQVSIYESIVYGRDTLGTETSKYQQEKKENIDFLSSGERKGKSPNQKILFSGVVDCIKYS